MSTSFSIVASGNTEQEADLVTALRDAFTALPANVGVAEMYGETTGATNLLNGPAAPPAPDPGAALSGVYAKDDSGALVELTVAQLQERQAPAQSGA